MKAPSKNREVHRIHTDHKVPVTQSGTESLFVDNRSIPAVERQLRETMDHRPGVRQHKALTNMMRDSARATEQRVFSQRIDNSPHMVMQRRQAAGLFGGAIQRVEHQEEHLLQGKFSTAQRENLEDDEMQALPLQAKLVAEAPAQLTQRSAPLPNNTGLPDQLKSGIESLSGMSMDHVKVHYNSAQPAQLNAHAYAQGSDIHMGPGQEKHLPHEAWHVVQQAQGRVQPTRQMAGGTAINDNQALEHEADRMGAAALQQSAITGDSANHGHDCAPGYAATPPMQRHVAQLTKQTIVQHGEMSGDQFQIAVALKIDPELRLILIGKNEKTAQDKSASIYDFYVNQSGIDPSRIHYYKVDGGMSDETRRILHAQHEDIFGQNTASVGQATNIVKDGFSEKDHTPEIRDTWMGSSGYSENDFGKLLRDFNIPLDVPTLVLWSRQSGALGGLHPEHDSSHTAMEQMMERFASEGYSLLIVGDDPDGKIGGMKGSVRFSKTVRLGQFWEKRGLWKKNRTAQFAFFEYLRRSVPTLTHIGMRSGNLEAFAYMGHRVIYLEEKDRTDSLRMDKISTDPDVKLNYRTIKLEQPPTLTGQLMMQATTLTNRIREKVVPALRKRFPEILKQLQLDTLDSDLTKVRNSTLPPYQKDMHLSRLIKHWVASIALKGIDVKNMLEKGKVHARDPIAVTLADVLDIISKLSKGFTPSDLDRIFDAVVNFSSRITEKPEEDPDEMEFGDYAVDQFSNDPEVMFWRNLNGLIQRSGDDMPALVSIILSLSPENRRKLRASYQEDLDLMLGYGGRVTPKIQRLVITIIDMLLTNPESLLKTHTRDTDPSNDGSSGGSGTIDKALGVGLAF